MPIRYRPIGGRNRAWSVDTWAEWQSIAVANFVDGDTMWYSAGKVALTRVNSRWKPNETQLWGFNDASAVPFGSIDSEGVWTIGTPSTGHQFTGSYVDRIIDCLAVVVATGAETMTISMADVYPHFAGIRCVYFSKAGTGATILSANASGIPGALGPGSAADGTSVRFRGEGGLVVAAGGEGGYATGYVGGISRYTPGVDDGNDTIEGSGNIVTWGSIGGSAPYEEPGS